MKYRKDIQILRGVAVFIVVLFHLGLGGFQSGFLGVDVFFVISGYLMAVLYNPNKKLEFFKRRALRLLPAYFVVTILMILVSILVVTPNEYNQIFEQSIYADLFASNIGYWMKNSYFSKSEFNLLLHLWSLGVEIQFYLILPILVYFFLKHSSFLWLITISSMSACLVIVEVSPKTSFFMTPFRLWEFLIGYGVAKYFSNNGNIQSTIKKQIVGSVFFFIILAIPLFKVDGQTLSILAGHPALYALLITVSTGFVLAYGLLTHIEKSLIANFFETIGKYSYSIYLVHFPVIMLYLYHPFSGTNLQVDGSTDLVILFFIITGLSIASYHLIEVRLTNNRRIFVILFAMPIAIITTSTLGRDIQKLRYSDAEFKTFNAFRDRSTYRCGKMFRVLNPGSITCEIKRINTSKDGGVLLVGNSHADSIKSVFADVAESRGLKLYFLVPNNPLMSGSHISVNRVIIEAKQHNVRHIVLHYSLNAISASVIAALAKKAGENDIDVSFIMPVPVWGKHIPKSLWENLKDNKPLPIQTKKDYLDATNALRESLKGLKLENFMYYEVYGYFCNDECIVVSADGRPLYFDYGHLTLTGSSRLSELFNIVLFGYR